MQGLCLFHDGTAYFGEWKGDYFNGSGIYLSKEGHIIDTVFAGTVEEPYKMKSDSELKILYQNGELYEGKGKNGK
jgi:hypothetical protein